MLIWEGKVQRNNVFDATIRDRPEEWTASIWREVYNFQPGGGSTANQTDLFIEDKFRTEADPKDGFPVKDCRDSRERRLLEFLIPIVHSDKPTQVTRTIGNTIFGALSGDRPVDWGKVFSDPVHRLVGGAGKAKPTPLCPFMYHLYECRGLLTEEEETDYTTAKELNWYEILPERDEDSDSGVLRITQPDPLLQEPIPVLNTDELASLWNWAEGGPEALTTPTTGTGQVPADLPTPGSTSLEHLRRKEERTK